MQRHHNSGRVSSIAQAGLAGVCSIFLVFLSISFLLAGVTLLAMSNTSGIEDNPHFQDDFFKHSRERSIAQKSSFRVAGTILLAIAIILIAVTIGLCIFVCRKASAASKSQPGQAGQVLVSGSQPPPPTGYHAQVAGSYPMGPQPVGVQPQPGYPGQQPAYPGQQPAYPTQQPAYPGQQPAYPGQQPAYPGQQPAYPGQQPGYPPQDDKYPSSQPLVNEPSAPPPPYNVVSGEKTGLH